MIQRKCGCRVPRWVFKIPGTLDKFLTKFQEVPTKFKKSLKNPGKPQKFLSKFRGISGIPGDLETLC
jgi:hypothetical protein